MEGMDMPISEKIGGFADEFWNIEKLSENDPKLTKI